MPQYVREISGSYSSNYEDIALSDVTLCSLAGMYQDFRETFCLHYHFSTLNMEAATSSKKMVNIYWTR
jgi:hypothetical protein